MKGYRLALALFLPLVDACSGGGAGSGSLPQSAHFVTAATRHAQGILPTPPPEPRYRVLYSFGGDGDGIFPSQEAPPINVDDVLYGTTPAGGSYSGGTVFKVTTSGLESVVYSFKGGKDGSEPHAGLTDVNGVLYGTTRYGGSGKNHGSVFAVSPSGAESVLYGFKGGTDGATPNAGLIDVNGVLYGTTAAGGTSNDGTIFAVSASGKERVLHSFKGGTDGRDPQAGLTDVNGVLYGTTVAGGTHDDGTVFAVSTSGTEKVLYSFKGGTDAIDPQASLIVVNGELYGTAFVGGTHNAGAVFKISTSGTESVVYNFKGGSDGAIPTGLIDVNGLLYGTTSSGGTGSSGLEVGLGTIYQLSLSGTETTLYSFKGQPDGANPGGLIEITTPAREVLFGATYQGGANDAGTVFSYCISRYCDPP